MREVAVTDGDRVESQIKYGWECNYYALGDLVDIINQVTEEEIDAKMKEYTDKYTMKTDRIDSVREQAKYEVGLEKFLSTNGIGAFADTFQDLHGLKQLPGIAAMVDMGDHFRIICADIELVKQPKPMPKLPVARIMYRHKPNFQIGTAAWCYAGGAHHSVVSTALTRDDIAMFARLTGTELITIGEDTTEADLQKFFMK